MEQLPGCRFDIGLAHQAFPHQKAPRAALRQPFEVRMRVDPAFRHQQRAFGRQRGEAFGGGEIGDESA